MIKKYILFIGVLQNAKMRKMCIGNLGLTAIIQLLGLP